MKISNHDEYAAAAARASSLSDAPEGSEAASELAELVTALRAWDEAHKGQNSHGPEPARRRAEPSGRFKRLGPTRQFGQASRQLKARGHATIPGPTARYGNLAYVVDLGVDMLWHRLEFVLGPTRDGVDIAFLVSHELKLIQLNRNRLGADAEESANVDYNDPCRSSTVHMRHRTDLFVARPVDCGAVQYAGNQLAGRQANMAGMIHDGLLLLDTL